MARLTENTVLARTRAQDLRSVKKLNCWGSELNDVSIIRRMPNVEVLSLSVNCISSLKDFAHCSNLQELYIRKNNISNLGEIQYLQNLSKLQNLWLADNPCAESEHYRLTVIRALPQLQKLDNITIRPEELESANKQDFPLDILGNVQIPEVSISENSYSCEEVTVSKTENGGVTVENSFAFQETTKCSSEFSLSNTGFELPKYESLHASNDQSAVEVSREKKLQNLEPLPLESISASQMSPVFENQDLFMEEKNSRLGTNVLEKELLLNTISASAASPRCALSASYNSRNFSRSEKTSPFRILPKGGKNRTSNILSAVLCLIKELDWPSLEVVDTAIHCQMEEMEQQGNSD